MRKFDEISVCIDSNSCARFDSQTIDVDAVNATSDFGVRLKHYEIDGFETEFIDEEFDSGRSSNSGSDNGNTSRLSNSVVRDTTAEFESLLPSKILRQTTRSRTRLAAAAAEAVSLETASF